MKYFNGTSYPESAKSAENDYLHLLACDNGTFTLSHKESGRVFFELPTLLVGADDMFAYCTHADIIKIRKESSAMFCSVQKISVPYGKTDKIYSLETTAVLRTTMPDDRDFIAFELDYQASEFDTVVRIPTGIEYPRINKAEYSGDMITLKPDELLTLSDSDGAILKIAVLPEYAPLDAAVTPDGNVDIYLPSIAPATEKTFKKLEFGILFS